jgi:hypothetical protein
MNTAPMIRKYRETLIPGIISMLLRSLIYPGSNAWKTGWR